MAERPFGKVGDEWFTEPLRRCHGHLVLRRERAIMGGKSRDIVAWENDCWVLPVSGVITGLTAGWYVAQWLYT